jgi:two-component system, OmpR family, sensor histidine kinase ArlS
VTIVIISLQLEEWGISLKLDRNGIRFRFWLVFFLLAVGITVFIGFLQIGLIRPYYRNSKIKSMNTVADEITEDIILNSSSDSIAQALRTTVDNDVCVQIYNESSKEVYSADSLGSGCLLNTSSFKNSEIFNSLSDSFEQNNNEYSYFQTNESTGQEMIVFGRKISSSLANYYMFVNAPLEPVDSIVTFFSQQYGIYTAIAIIIASILALYISNKITEPIVRMKSEAIRLSNADYSVQFTGGSFTETKELASTLNDTKDKLAKIDEMRRDLIANVSHDIRTPLTDIRAYAEMIRDISGDNAEKRNKHLEVIIHETEYMSRLINDMSELSRMQSGNEMTQRENIDLVEIIYEVVQVNESLLKNAGLKIEINVPDELTIYFNRVKMAQVVSNYLTNAIKHTQANHTIYINAYVEDDEETVRLEVKDEGEGIPEDELPYIWDRYQKSSRTFRRNMTNTGLGLSIVKAIADTYGAKVGVITEVGKGSTFYFEIRETHEA